MKKLYQDEQWLWEQYWEKELSLSETARLASCEIRTISRWFKKYNIPRRTLSQMAALRDEKRYQDRIYRNKEWLYKQYWKENLGIAQIAKKANAGQGTIVRWMDIYKIPRRHERLDEKWRIKQLEKKRKLRRNSAHYMERNRTKKWMDSNWLYEQYWQKGLSLSQVGSLCNVDAMTIRNWMIKFNMPRRTKTENGLIINLGGPYRNGGWLRQKYLDECLSPRAIADICGVGKTAIDDWIERFDIKKRGLSEAIRLALPKSTARRNMYNEDWRRKNAEATRAAWKRGAYDNLTMFFGSPTSIEIKTSAALDTANILHQSQYRPNGCSFIFDEFISPDLLLEIHGDYWHGNPTVYSSLDLDEIQRKQIKKDAKKANWAEENGYHLVILWEREIKELGAWPLLRSRLPGIFV